MKALTFWIYAKMQLIIENEKTADLSSSTHPTSDATRHGDHLLYSYKWREGSGSSCGLGGEPNPLTLG